MFDMFREFAYGLRLGARHSLDTRHNLTENALRPSVSAALRDKKVGSEQFGH